MIDTISHGLIGNAIAVSQSSIFGVGNATFRISDTKKPCYVDTLAFGAHKREVFTKIGGYDEDMICNQDDEFNFRVIQAGMKIWMDPTIKIKYYSRSNFIQLFKQYYYYGCYKVRGIQKRKSIFSFRHLVPSAFIISLFSTLLLYFLDGNVMIMFSVLILYCLVNLFFSIKESHSFLFIPFIFISFLCLHFGYGLGFIWGLILFIGKWGDSSLKDKHFNIQQYHNTK